MTPLTITLVVSIYLSFGILIGIKGIPLAEEDGALTESQNEMLDTDMKRGGMVLFMAVSWLPIFLLSKAKEAVRGIGAMARGNVQKN